jgi:arabinose-5-phosphate isomerase
LSNSGETAELLTIIPIIKRTGAKLIALTGEPASSLAKLADAHLDTGVEKEACPLNLAPTASTTAALALGDALAVALLDARGFDADDFARSHPGGSLGRRLLTLVSDVMRTGDALPTVPSGASLPAAILEVTRKRMGMTAVVAPDGRLAGLFTDGDLRRVLERTTEFGNLTVDEVMTRSPTAIAPDALAVEAVRRMEERRISQLPVVDAEGRMVGALHIHDLLIARVV